MLLNGNCFSCNGSGKILRKIFLIFLRLAIMWKKEEIFQIKRYLLVASCFSSLPMITLTSNKNLLTRPYWVLLYETCSVLFFSLRFSPTLDQSAGGWTCISNKNNKQKMLLWILCDMLYGSLKIFDLMSHHLHLPAN